MKKRLLVILIVDVLIAAVALVLILLRIASIVAVGITMMVCAFSFNYLMLRPAVVPNSSADSGIATGSVSDRALLQKLALVLAGLGGLALTIAGLGELFVLKGEGAIIKSLIQVGFGLYFVNVYLRNRSDRST